MFGLLQTNPLVTFQRVWRGNSRPLKTVALSGLFLGIVGAIAAYLPLDPVIERVGNVFIGLAVLTWAYLETSVRVEQQSEIEARIEKAENAVIEHPDKARPLWDLARSRLELYFERNLSQIKSIFWITVLIMCAGFVMIGYGIMQAFENDKMNASILAAASGVLTEFIAATFLIIYRSIMAQASEYVRTLERINAVGMAIQIADSISDDDKALRSKVRAELGKKILDVFISEAPRHSGKARIITRPP